MPDIKNSPIPPVVTVMLDKERTLKYPLPSIFAFEDLTGLDLLGAGISDPEEFYGGTKEKPATIRQRFSRVIDMIWAGCIADDPKITREFVASFVYPKDVEALDEKCSLAYRAAMRQASAEDEQSAPLAETVELETK